jgi:AraC-like DNA-binding protein
VAARPGETLFISSPKFTQLDLVASPPHVGEILCLPRGLIEKVLEETSEGAGCREFELALALGQNTQHGYAISRLIQAISVGLRAPSAVPSLLAPLLTEAVLQLIVTNVVGIPSRGGTDHPAHTTPDQLRRAIEFMRANIHRPLTISEVAEVAGVSLRALQYAFQKFEERSPTAFLRSLRLGAVRAELSSPDNILSVQDVASKWGFEHMGHFARHYRAAYGIYPSQTAKASKE